MVVNDSASNSAQTASFSGTGTGVVSFPGYGVGVVQVQNNLDLSGAAFTTFTVNLAPTYPGDLLVAFVRESSSATDNFTVTDSADQTWALTPSRYENESSTGPRIGMFYMANSAAVSSVTAHYTTSGGVIKPGIMVMEISTDSSYSPVGTGGSVNNASGASVTTSTSASLSPPEITNIFIFATDTAGNQTGWTPGSAPPWNNNGPCGAGGNYLIPNNKVAVGASGSNARMAMQIAVVSCDGPGTFSTSMTYPNAAWNGNIFAAFK